VIILGSHLISGNFLNVVIGSIAVILVEPVFDTINGTNDVKLGIFERKIVKRTSFVKIWLIFKVPRLLKHSTVIFNVICEGDALSEWMVFFNDKFWVRFLEGS